MRKRFQIAGSCLFVLLVIVALSVMIGSFVISPSSTLWTLSGGGSSTRIFAVFQIRFPRIVLVILVGSALGVSGATLQRIMKNPPTEPGMIGVDAGNVLFVVLWISYGANTYYNPLPNVKVLFMPLSAIARAFCTTAFLYAYSWRRGVRPIRSLLAGVGVNAGTTAVVSFYQLQMGRGDHNQVLMWVNGFLWGSSWRYILVSAPFTPFLAGLVWTYSRAPDILSLSNEGAAALDVSTRRIRILFLAAGTALAVLVMTVAGNIVFLGLLGPQVALRIIDMRYRLLLLLAALISPMLLVVADMSTRDLLSLLEISAGIPVSIIGIPCFIYLMMKLDRRQYNARST